LPAVQTTRVNARSLNEPLRSFMRDGQRTRYGRYSQHGSPKSNHSEYGQHQCQDMINVR
jgi:hypothetical protein